MKLYFTPGTCAMAPHLVANELDIPLELIAVDLLTRKTAEGDDYTAVNPNGYVPTLILDDDDTLTEAAVLVQYLADQRPEGKLVPGHGTIERYHVQKLLNFIATELHKSFGVFFRPAATDDAKEAARAHILRRLSYPERLLEGRSYLTGEGYSVADTYFWTVLTWAERHKIGLSDFKNIPVYMARVAARPATIKTLNEQGLLS